MSTIKITDMSRVHEVEVRKTTNRFLEMIEDNIIRPYDAVLMCLKWMGEDGVAEMCEANNIFETFEDEDEEEIEIDELYHDCSEEELRKMGCFCNLTDEEDESCDA